MIYKTRGIILKRIIFREDDRLLSIYTLDHGKIQALAKGALKIKSKLAAHLEPLSLTQLTLARGKGFDRIASAQLRENYGDLKNNFNKVMLAGRALKVVDELTKLEQKEERIFGLILNFLEELNAANGRVEEHRVLASDFALKLLSLLGYTPELYNCVSCREKIVPEKNYFHLLKGGLTCSSCFIKYDEGRDQNVLPISVNAIKILRLMLREKLGVSNKIKTESQIFEESNKIVRHFLRVYLS